jgi:hypothetical protein
MTLLNSLFESRLLGAFSKDMSELDMNGGSLPSLACQLASLSAKIAKS